MLRAWLQLADGVRAQQAITEQRARAVLQLQQLHATLSNCQGDLARLAGQEKDCTAWAALLQISPGVPP